MRFIFTCGGTAGHVNPALAVAGRLKELLPDSEFLFLGAEGKMEMELVPRAGYDIKALKISNISRGKNLKALAHNIKTLKNVIISGHEAKAVIRDFKPDAVIGTGGYVCYTVLKAAARLGIPTAVHESNAVPGLTTKLLAKTVDRIMVGFEESRQYYPEPDKVIVTGTPVRGEFAGLSKKQARRELGMDEKEKLVVSVWGSLGAGHMNSVMTQCIPLMDGTQGFRMIYAAGKAYYPSVLETLEETAPGLPQRKVDLREYIFDMPRVMAAADLVMCRAGASTISELTYMGLPAILVPSPNVTNNHQEKNARVLEKAGGAQVLLEGEFDAASLLENVKALLADEKKLEAMSAAMRSMSMPDAADKISSIILGILK